MAWAESLVIGTATDWRLPSAGDTPASGYYNTLNELGHLYYTELGNDAHSTKTIALQKGPFNYLHL